MREGERGGVKGVRGCVTVVVPPHVQIVTDDIEHTGARKGALEGVLEGLRVGVLDGRLVVWLLRTTNLMISSMRGC